MPWPKTLEEVGPSGPSPSSARTAAAGARPSQSPGPGGGPCRARRLRQAADQDGDEDDVVHAQDDLQGGEHRKGDPEVGVEQEFHEAYNSPPPITNTRAWSDTRARASSRVWATSTPSCCQAVLRVTMMLRRPGRGRPMDSKVLRPMMTGQPRVVRLKNLRSSGRCHSRALSLPMAPLRATAAIRMRVEVGMEAFKDAVRVRVRECRGRPACAAAMCGSDRARA
jgi:hypothetical protein